MRGCHAIYVATAEALDEALVTLDQDQMDCGAAVVRTRRP
jgi:hypothetical protein